MEAAMAGLSSQRPAGPGGLPGPPRQDRTSFGPSHTMRASSGVSFEWPNTVVTLYFLPGCERGTISRPGAFILRPTPSNHPLTLCLPEAACCSEPRPAPCTQRPGSSGDAGSTGLGGSSGSHASGLLYGAPQPPQRSWP